MAFESKRFRTTGIGHREIHFKKQAIKGIKMKGLGLPDLN